MAKNSKIEWTTHTFNPWRGCSKVSPGCAHCYAEQLVTTRLKGEWGPGAPRQLAKDATWRQPLAWNREANVCLLAWERREEGSAVLHYEKPTRPRVFCASLADVFDREVPTAWRVRLFALIEATPHLDWLLLTKRPQRWAARTFEAAGAGCAFAQRWIAGEAPANVWIGTSVEDQRRADERIPELLSIPARVRFLSMEPLLGPVTLFDVDGEISQAMVRKNPRTIAFPADLIDWVIVGGESGTNARPMHPDWARSLRDQCADVGVPFFFKQWGEWYPIGDVHGRAVRVDRVEIDGRLVPASCYHDWSDGFLSLRIGKKTAGRLLDGLEHSAFPACS